MVTFLRAAAYVTAHFCFDSLVIYHLHADEHTILWAIWSALRCLLGETGLILDASVYWLHVSRQQREADVSFNPGYCYTKMVVR